MRPTGSQPLTIYFTLLQEKGLTFGTISHFDGMETGKVLAHVIEGEITSVNCVYVDGNGNPVGSGSTNPRVVRRELPFRVGTLYNVEDAKRALRDIFLLQLFDNVQVVPKPDDDDPQKVAVDIVLKERPLKTAEVRGPSVSVSPSPHKWFPQEALTNRFRNCHENLPPLNRTPATRSPSFLRSTFF
jgi:hypothetical protein